MRYQISIAPAVVICVLVDVDDLIVRVRRDRGMPF